jgi:hypothetical protein
MQIILVLLAAEIIQWEVVHHHEVDHPNEEIAVVVVV